MIWVSPYSHVDVSASVPSSHLCSLFVLACTQVYPLGLVFLPTDAICQKARVLDSSTLCMGTPVLLSCWMLLLCPRTCRKPHVGGFPNIPLLDLPGSCLRPSKQRAGTPVLPKVPQVPFHSSQLLPKLIPGPQSSIRGRVESGSSRQIRVFPLRSKEDEAIEARMGDYRKWIRKTKGGIGSSFEQPARLPTFRGPA